MGVAALLGLFAVVSTPTVPWSLAGVLILAGVLGWWEPRVFRVGVVAAWTAGTGAGGWILFPALVLGARRWGRVSTGLVVLALVLAARQVLVGRELPPAREGVPELIVTLVLAATAWAAATPPRTLGWADARGLATAALVATGLVLLGRLGWVLHLEGPAQLAGARRIDATRLVYGPLTTGAADLPAGAPLLCALVAAVPDRDEAALRLPLDLALGLGWRPVAGGEDPVPVALALESRGRGGEALRMLARHPREGAVDWVRALLERTQGDPVRWAGGRLPGVLTLPGHITLDRTWDTNTYEALLLQVDRPVPKLVLTGKGSSYEGDPVVTVRVDTSPERSWILSGPGRIELPGPFEAGPHRVELRFAGDRFGPGGDRNVYIEALVGE